MRAWSAALEGGVLGTEEEGGGGVSAIVATLRVDDSNKLIWVGGRFVVNFALG